PLSVSRAADAKDHVVAIARHLVVEAAAFGTRLNSADARYDALERVEEGRVERQFPLLHDASSDALPEVLERQLVGRLDQFNSCVESFKEWKTPHAADEDEAAVGNRRDGLLEYARKIGRAREVLRDGVQYDGVECLRFNALEVVGAPAQKTRWRRGPVPMTLDVIERRLRDVRPAVFGAVRGDTEEQQTRATTDFEHTRRATREDALDRLFDPLPHLFCRDRLAGVAAVPTRDVEGRIDGVRLGGVCVVEYTFPLCDALDAKLPASRLLLRAFIQHEIGHQALFARRVFTSVHDHVLHGRMLTQHGFDLARLDAQATYLDLVIRAPEEFNLPLGEIAREVARAVKTHAR